MRLVRLRVTVAYCAPGIEDLTQVTLPAGATVGDAVVAAMLLARRPELKDAMDAGVWGQRCSLDRKLANGERVEIYRSLKVDPKDGRRLRGDLRRERRFKS